MCVCDNNKLLLNFILLREFAVGAISFVFGSSTHAKIEHTHTVVDIVIGVRRRIKIRAHANDDIKFADSITANTATVN